MTSFGPNCRLVIRPTNLVGAPTSGLNTVLTADRPRLLPDVRSLSVTTGGSVTPVSSTRASFPLTNSGADDKTLMVSAADACEPANPASSTAVSAATRQWVNDI